MLNLDYSKLTQVYGDEFNNNSMVDHITKWDSVYYWGGTMNSQFHWGPAYTCYRDNTHSLHDGKLFLKIKPSSVPIPNIPSQEKYYATNRSYPYYYVSSSLIRSKYNEVIPGSQTSKGFRFGVIEIRCKMPQSEGLYPCIWLEGVNNPMYAMAIREAYTPSTKWLSNAQYPPGCVNAASVNCASCPWWWGNPVLCGGEFNFPYTIDDRFHTYHLVWTPERMSWFFDGREYLSIQPPSAFTVDACTDTFLKMDLIFDIEYNHFCQTINPVTHDTSYASCEDVNLLPINQDSVQIDYIRIYKPTSGSWTNFNYKKDAYHGNASNTMATTVSNQTLASNFIDHVWYKGTDNKLWNIYWANYQWNSSLLNSSAPADVLSDVFYDNGNNRIYYRNSLYMLKWFSWNGSSYVLNYDGVNNVAGWVDVNTTLHSVFYKGLDGKLWNYYKNSSGTYVKLAVGGNTNVNSYVKSSPDGQSVFYRGNDGFLWRYYQSGSIWINQKITTPQNSSITVVGDISPASSNLVYFRGPLNKVLCWDGQLGSVYELTPDLANCAGYIVNNQNGVFYKGNDNRLWHLYWHHDQWYYESIDYNNPNVSGSMTTSSDGKLFYIGSPTSGTTNTIWEVNTLACKPFTMLGCSHNGGYNYYKTDQIVKEHFSDKVSHNVITDSALDFDLFPNPTTGVANVKLKTTIDQVVSVEVFDYTGAKIESFQHSGNSQSGLVSDYFLDVSKYAQGIYFVTVKTNNYQKTKRFVKE